MITPRGQRLVADARAIFRELEDTLGRRIGARNVTQLRRALQADWGQPVARR